MFSLVISIISIALVAALAIATIYYGGTAFNKSSVDADALQLMSQGDQIMAAMTLYKTDHGVWPSTQAQLTSPDSSGRIYLKSWPTGVTAMAPAQSAMALAAVTGTWSIVPGHPAIKYTSGVSEDVCRSVNKLSRGDNGILKALSTQYGSQCYSPGTSSAFTVVITRDPSLEVFELIDSVNIISDLAPEDSDSALWAKPPVVSKVKGDFGGLLSIRFDNVAVGVQQAQTLTLTNTGRAASTVTSVTFSSSLTDVPGLVVDGSACTEAGPIIPGDSCTISVTYDPAGLDVYSGTLVVGAGNAQRNSYSTQVVITPPPIVNQAPILSIDQESLSFSAIAEAFSTTQSIRISNIGDAVMSSITTTPSNPGYIVTNDCVVVQPGEFCTASVKALFNTAGSPNSAILRIESDGGVKEVALTATIDPIPAPVLSVGSLQLNFNAVVNVTTNPQTVVITNNGTGVIQGFNIGTDDNRFSASPIGCTSLAAGESCTVSVTALFSTVGAVTGKHLVIETSAGTAQVDLSANVTAEVAPPSGQVSADIVSYRIAAFFGGDTYGPLSFTEVSNSLNLVANPGSSLQETVFLTLIQNNGNTGVTLQGTGLVYNMNEFNAAFSEEGPKSATLDGSFLSSDLQITSYQGGTTPFCVMGTELPAGGSCELFTYSSSTGPTQNSISINLGGGLSKSITFVKNGMASTPSLSISGPAEQTIDVDSTANVLMRYTATNSGGAITGASMVARFYADNPPRNFITNPVIVNDTCTGNDLPQGGTCTFDVQIDPSSLSGYTSDFTLEVYGEDNQGTITNDTKLVNTSNESTMYPVLALNTYSFTRDSTLGTTNSDAVIIVTNDGTGPAYDIQTRVAGVVGFKNPITEGLLTGAQLYCSHSDSSGRTMLRPNSADFCQYTLTAQDRAVGQFKAELVVEGRTRLNQRVEALPFGLNYNITGPVIETNVTVVNESVTMGGASKTVQVLAYNIGSGELHSPGASIAKIAGDGTASDDVTIEAVACTAPQLVANSGNYCEYTLSIKPLSQGPKTYQFRPVMLATPSDLAVQGPIVTVNVAVAQSTVGGGACIDNLRVGKCSEMITIDMSGSLSDPALFTREVSISLVNRTGSTLILEDVYNSGGLANHVLVYGAQNADCAQIQAGIPCESIKARLQPQSPDGAVDGYYDIVYNNYLYRLHFVGNITGVPPQDPTLTILSGSEYVNPNTVLFGRIPGVATSSTHIIVSGQNLVTPVQLNITDPRVLAYSCQDGLLQPESTCTIQLLVHSPSSLDEYGRYVGDLGTINYLYQVSAEFSAVSSLTYTASFAGLGAPSDAIFASLPYLNVAETEQSPGNRLYYTVNHSSMIDYQSSAPAPLTVLRAGVPIGTVTALANSSIDRGWPTEVRSASSLNIIDTTRDEYFTGMTVYVDNVYGGPGRWDTFDIYYGDPYPFHISTSPRLVDRVRFRPIAGFQGSIPVQITYALTGPQKDSYAVDTGSSIYGVVYSPSSVNLAQDGVPIAVSFHGKTAGVHEANLNVTLTHNGKSLGTSTIRLSQTVEVPSYSVCNVRGWHVVVANQTAPGYTPWMVCE